MPGPVLSNLKNMMRWTRMFHGKPPPPGKWVLVSCDDLDEPYFVAKMECDHDGYPSRWRLPERTVRTIWGDDYWTRIDPPCPNR